MATLERKQMALTTYMAVLAMENEMKMATASLSLLKVTDERIFKDILYAKLVRGKRTIGRPKLAYRDVCKQDIMTSDIYGTCGKRLFGIEQHGDKVFEMILWRENLKDLKLPLAGCIKDIRINDFLLPVSQTEISKASFIINSLKNVLPGCHDYDFCSNLQCILPLICVSRWRHAECTCPNGHLRIEDKRECRKVSFCHETDNLIDVDYKEDGDLCGQQVLSDCDGKEGYDEHCFMINEELTTSKTTKLLLFVFISIVIFIGNK
ncbi:hypothetical protein HELRODRAFT_175872 [Helobdella robusta]|uniref:Uncharacterized protein n=1 Tax=Helobdella robusta TaxID=6412 RepID=T1F9T2_HELRO|nr:hypothetical protein HELRODRAFT_175872 [Helobdella robusta]ESO00441.1 hypothetical protein HELRODRAFT_175872 [Helobdella robusta]